MPSGIELKRSVSQLFLIMYGLGTIVGGGIYALIGKVSQEALMYTPIAMVLSGLFALMTGLSYAELGSRLPYSAGEVRFIETGFGKARIAQLTGMLVILTGIVSSAALAVATVGFADDFVDLPDKLAVALLVLLMGAIAAWGIGESVAVVAAITVIEVGGLIYVISAAGVNIPPDASWNDLVPPPEPAVWIGIFAGAFLAFYAFVGFEDMVNLAEEVKDVRRTLPAGIVVSMVLAMVLYCLIALAAVSTVPVDRLASSSTPLAEMVREQGDYAMTGLGIVSLLSGFNGALVQIIMSSRVAYGSAKQGLAPGWFAEVHPLTRTPLRATAVVVGIILVLAVLFPLTTLAKVTSGIILVVFGAVNLALWQIKRADPDPDGEGLRLPNWLPLAGAFGCALVLTFQLWLLLKP